VDEQYEDTTLALGAFNGVEVVDGGTKRRSDKEEGTRGWTY